MKVSIDIRHVGHTSVTTTSSGGIARAPMAEWPIAVIVLIICFFNVACYITISSSRLLLVSHRKAGVPAAAAPLTWFAWDLVEADDLVSCAATMCNCVMVVPSNPEFVRC